MNVEAYYRVEIGSGLYRKPLLVDRGCMSVSNLTPTKLNLIGSSANTTWLRMCKFVMLNSFSGEVELKIRLESED